MTRKDTIIAAALVNAGLLVILFVSALSNEQKGQQITFHKAYSDPVTEERIFQSEYKKSSGVDEVEEVLKQYAQKESSVSQTQVLSTETLPSSEPAPVLNASVPESIAVVKAPVEPAEKTGPVNYIEVQVKKGDVLEKIAKEHRTTVSDILKLNNLSSSKLKIGQTLKVSPRIAPQQSARPVVKAPLEPTSAKYYTIKPGDNLWTIAVRNHSKVEDLLKLNNMSEEKAKKLRPGDSIRIR